MSDETEAELLDRVCAMLHEHFDSVQIFVTTVRRDKDNELVTSSWHRGYGNIYARYGITFLWCKKQEHENMKDIP